MNREHILDVLAAYTGSPETMKQVVATLEEAFGDNWTDKVFVELADVPEDLHRKLKHAFSYYAATMAWNEVQEYLTQTAPLDLAEMDARWPIFGRWLEFFGDAGAEVLEELKQKILAQQQGVPAEEKKKADKTAQKTEQTQKEADVPEEAWQPSEMRVFEDGKVLKTREIEQELKSQSKNKEKSKTVESIPDSPEAFTVRKVMTQVELLKSVQNWLAARCISLHNIEVYAYPFYGFVVDLLRQTLKDMESLQDKTEYEKLLDQLYPDGKAGFDRQKEAIQNDISLAEQNCESAMTTLISADIDMDLVRQTLGSIDDSGTIEYLGPAPDGFEALDTDEVLDETAIKEQYAKIEGKSIPLASIEAESQSVKDQKEKQKTSHSEKKSVQKKLSFSLKNKKSTGGAS
ncbi:MAG: hypothetical protein J6Y85_02180 [Alphaproteobacteria bacterium]|nr:hypothetical protein [Alphaproteobacteria bacterium]